MTTYIDLCAGTGGFSQAFNNSFRSENNGFRCIFANDFIKDSECIYKSNFPKHKFVLEDLNKFDLKKIPKHDILCAGFSCQPISIAGNQKGFDDSRFDVFWTIMKIINLYKPNIVVFENVKNLKSHDKGKTYRIIKESIEKEGYFIKDCILDTCQITDIPQHRERIYIVCFRNKEQYEKFNFNFPKIKNKKLNNFLEPIENIQLKYYYTNKLKMYDTIKEAVTEKDKIYQYRRYYVRENKKNVCPTLTANMGSGGHNVPLILDDKGIRKLTPRECFNLQGFPQDYQVKGRSDSALYRLAGNAITVPVMSLIAEKLLKLILI